MKLGESTLRLRLCTKCLRMVKGNVRKVGTVQQ